MKSWTASTTLRAGPLALLMRLLAYGATALCLAAWSQVLSPAIELPDSDLVVHEWGTFTSVSGSDGVSLEWRPLSGPSDLPSFVYGSSAADTDPGW